MAVVARSDTYKWVSLAIGLVIAVGLAKEPGVQFTLVTNPVFDALGDDEEDVQEESTKNEYGVE